MDSTHKLIDELFAMKMFHCAHCKDVLQTPVMLVEKIGNVCHSCYDIIKGEVNLVAVENIFVNTVLEKVEIPCENGSQGCSERIPYKEIEEHKRRCMYQNFHCKAPEECSWTGCLKDFEIHYRQTHKSYHFQIENNSCLLGISLGELKVGLYLLQTTCGDFFLSVNKTDQDIAFNIYDIGESINCEYEFFYHFSVTFSGKNGRKFSSDCKITDWMFVTMNDVECYNETKINLECFSYIFQSDIVFIEVILNEESNYISNEECILENLRCKKCQSYLTSEIYPSSDSYICSSCANNISRHYYYTSRSLVLENAVKKIRFPCKFKDRGCLVKMAVNNIKHEFSCPYRNLKCTISECEFTGTRLLLINHLEQSHTCPPCMITSTANAKRLFFYLTIDNLLFQVFHKNSFPNFIMWTVDIIGYTEQDYYYQIEVSFGQIDMTLKAPCKLEMSTFTETEKKITSTVKLTRDTLQEVGYDGSELQYVIQVLKC